MYQATYHLIYQFVYTLIIATSQDDIVRGVVNGIETCNLENFSEQNG